MRTIDAATAYAVQRFLHLIGDRYRVHGAVLFGSRARGDYEEGSDADVAVILAGSHLSQDVHQERVDIKLDMSDSAYDAMFDTGILVSPFPVWETEYESGRPQFSRVLFQNIFYDGVKIA